MSKPPVAFKKSEMTGTYKSKATYISFLFIISNILMPYRFTLTLYPFPYLLHHVFVDFFQIDIFAQHIPIGP